MGMPVHSATRQAAPEFAYRELDRVRVKGRTESVRIHQPIGRRDELPAEALEEVDRFHRATGLLRNRQWEPARQGLAELAEAANGQDAPLYRVYLDRIDAYLAEPPGEEWDGTVRYKRK